MLENYLKNKAFLRALEKEEGHEGKKARLRKELAVVENAIDEIKEPDAAEILTLRYLQGMQWTAICRRVHMSESTVFRIHKLTVKKMKLTVHDS